jgi:hypothetical protein
MLPKQTKRILIIPLGDHVSCAAESIGSIDGTRIIAVAMRAAQIIYETFPATSPENAVDSLRGSLRVKRLLNRGLIIVVSIPIMAPVVDIASHIIEAVIIGRIAHHRGCIRAKEIGLRALNMISCGIEKVQMASAGCDLPFRFGREALAYPFGIGDVIPTTGCLE